MYVRCPSRCGGCRDFSSRAPSLPNIAAADVVEAIVRRAAANSIQRAASFDAGLMSDEELGAADTRLAGWLAQTFCGRNRHFASSEGWNPEGLARHIRSTHPYFLRSDGPGRAVTDEQVVTAAAAAFLRELYDLAEGLREEGLGWEELAGEERMRRFLSRWTMLLSGAPA